MNEWMNEWMGFKVARHLKHIGATPSPPAGTVVNTLKQHGNRMHIVTAIFFF